MIMIQDHGYGRVGQIALAESSRCELEIRRHVDESNASGGFRW
jgi:hypothetical protein